MAMPALAAPQFPAGALRRRGLLWSLLALIALGPGAVPALAQAQNQAQPPIVEAPGGPGTIERAQAEADELAFDLSVKYMSPYCPGASLRDCTSGQAAVLRDEIRDWLRAGATIGWIEEQLVARHGESILGAPRFRGFNTLVWIFPVLALLVGLGLIFSYLSRQHSMSLAKVPARDVGEDYQPDPDLERRLEKELTERSR